MKINETLRHRAKQFATYSVIAIGVVASLATILPFLKFYVWVVGLIAAELLFWLFVWMSTKQKSQLPSDMLEETDNLDGEVYLECPSAHDMIVAANRHARWLFGEDSLPLEQVQKWNKKNQFVLAVLRAQNGHYLGYFDILPMTTEAIEKLQGGDITEKEITDEMILPPQEMRNSKTLYIAGIAVIVN